MAALVGWVLSFLSPPPPVEDHQTKVSRVTEIFNKLLQNAAFLEIWEEINKNVHKPIIIRPSPPKEERNYTVDACLALKRECPPNCPKKEEGGTTIFPHAFGIYVNVDQRKHEDIANAIIFETCNAKFWEQHNALFKKVVDLEITDPDEFATRMERIEWEALKLAKTIFDTIPEYRRASLPISDFDKHLEVQKRCGHYAFNRKKFFTYRPPECTPPEVVTTA